MILLVDLPTLRQRFDVRPVGETLAGLFESLQNGSTSC